MSVWILTTGNSDVRLKHDRNWNKLFQLITNELDCQDFSSAKPINTEDKREGFTAPARVLGLTYDNQPDFFDDLQFPLINTFYQKLQQDKIQLDKIIILLTDQSNLFNEWERANHKCPYWQDTVNLKPLLTKYFQDKFPGSSSIKLDFIILAPKLEKELKEGLDHWDATLKLIKTEFENLQVNSSKTVYLSHQAGTPAISSAVQFVSLGKFKNVKFLVSNQYYDDDFTQQAKAEFIDSSQYWRGLQIQKAKQLIVSGFPGAALKILEQIPAQPVLEKLSQQVDFFNLHSRDTDNKQDFDIPEATQRIINALDLISLFFSNQNYIQGISLIAAAQETFMKVGIISKIMAITDTINIDGKTLLVSELIKWQPLGLFLSDEIKNQSVDIKRKVLYKLKFPERTLDSKLISLKSNDDFKVTNKNFALISWLTKLESNFKPWSLLKWSCKQKYNSDKDLRNQFLHNLRGMETQDVIKYLTGDDIDSKTNDNVMEIYNNQVKKQFLAAIDLFKLPYKREKIRKLLQDIADELV